MATGVLPAVQAQEKVFAERAQAFISRVTSEKTPAVVVLVARDGQIAFQGAGGQADLEKNVAATVETKFRIGSVTKQFTAAAILKLAENGKLKIRDPLDKYYPDFKGAKNITLEHLLTHTSGFTVTQRKGEFYSRVSHPIKSRDLIDWTKNDEPDFAPGPNSTTATQDTSCSARSLPAFQARPMANT